MRFEPVNARNAGGHNIRESTYHEPNVGSEQGHGGVHYVVLSQRITIAVRYGVWSRVRGERLQDSIQSGVICRSQGVGAMSEV